MSKIKIQKLEYHLTNSCNLSCSGCSHYSNIIKGHTKSPEEFKGNLAAWSRILDVERFNFLGGEPLVNRKILEFCDVAREILPDSEIYIFTNGLLLGNIDSVAYAENFRRNKVRIQMTYHSFEAEYKKKIEPNIAILKSWSSDCGIRVVYKDGVTNWTKRYLSNEDGTISPFDDENPEKSWGICSCKYATTLVDEKIYKCAPIAYLQYVKEANKTSPDFDKYLDRYEPISHSDKEDKIRAFFDKNFKPESVCGMCPSRSIKVKNKSI
jgi:organic radical activating enzyme